MPTVSVLIAAHGRPQELRVTLRALQEQTYRPLELIVIDDASPEPLQPVVEAEWPDATVIRHERSLGAHVSRSEGMRRVTGDFILTLDDDSSPLEPDVIQGAVDRFAAEPRLGVIALRIVEGEVHPSVARSATPQRYVHDFVNCGQMQRTSVAREVGDYRDFFYYYTEESDYALRVLDRGWRILFMPALAVWHRRSSIGRRRGRIVGYRLRNTLWTIVLDYPAPRVFAALPFKLVGGLWEVVRLGEWSWGAWALWSFAGGLRKVLRLRSPVSRDTIRRVDILRFRWVEEASEFESGARLPLGERIRWYLGAWPQRQRFSRRSGGDHESAGRPVFVIRPPSRPGGGQANDG